MSEPVRHRRPNRKMLATGAFALALVVLVAWVVAGSNPGTQPASASSAEQRVTKQGAGRPNVVMIYTDDQDLTTFNADFMPRTFRTIVDRGTKFTQSIVSTPICCPSRIGFLTGQYPHNNDVFSNNDGYPALSSPKNTLPGWLGDAGYRTAWFGKFLHRYENIENPDKPAPGWDEWAVTVTSRYFDYTLHEKNDSVSKGNRDSDYHTNVMTQKALGLIRRSRSSNKPYFMTLNYLAPHKGEGNDGRCSRSAAPARRDLGSASGLALPQPPSFDEDDISDKRAYVVNERIGPKGVKKLRINYQCRAESLRAVDRGIGRVVAAVRKANQLKNTIFVFASDNGVMLGQHRLQGKGVPYEEAIRVPFAIRAPQRLLDADAVAETDTLVGNIDIAPTILDLTGLEPCLDSGRCRRMDGRSLVPLIEGNPAGYPADRRILVEGSFMGAPTCDFRAVRAQSSVQILRAKGDPRRNGCRPTSESETYDLAQDPFQIDNLGVTNPIGSAALRADLEGSLDRLGRCSGIAGRDPDRPGPFCD